MHLYAFLVYVLFAFIVCAGAPRKSTQESYFETSRSVRESKKLRMRATSAPSIITKSCHSLQLIAISRHSINKLSAQWISYYTCCYNERIHKLVELRTWSKTHRFERWVNFWRSPLHRCIFCQVCFANIRQGLLIPRGPKRLLTSPIS